jgi:site-specific recombinase XerC
MTALAPYLSAFLLEHLPRERKASPHTTDAYANSFKLLVCFAAARLRVKPFQMALSR